MNSNTKNNLEQALTYLEKYGWVVIPIGLDKKPLVAWKKYQHQKPSFNQIRDWWQQYPNANIGIVTGNISKIVVIDIDPRHGGNNELFKSSEVEERRQLIKLVLSNLRVEDKLVRGLLKLFFRKARKPLLSLLVHKKI